MTKRLFKLAVQADTKSRLLNAQIPAADMTKVSPIRTANVLQSGFAAGTSAMCLKMELSPK